MIEESKSCAIASPSKCNTQLSPLECATAYATDMQPHRLKGAALRILARNKACNSCTTEAKKSAQLSVEKQGLNVAQHSPEIRIRAWLAHIGETHQPIIEEVMEMIATDPAALAYYMKRADEVLRPADHDIDRVTRNAREAK